MIEEFRIKLFNCMKLLEFKYFRPRYCSPQVYKAKIFSNDLLVMK